MIETVSVIGGGWSAGSIAKPPVGLGFVIGVNDAALHCRCDAVLSMDRLWSENRWPILLRRNAETHLRRSAVKNVRERPDWLHVFENDHTETSPSLERGTLNGTNSGMCALNLALQLHPKRVVLFGFDMNRSPEGRAYWWEPYVWAKREGATSGGKYRVWASEFTAFAKAFRDAGIEVVNTSMTTAITAFQRRPLEAVR